MEQKIKSKFIFSLLFSILLIGISLFWAFALNNFFYIKKSLAQSSVPQNAFHINNESTFDAFLQNDSTYGVLDNNLTLGANLGTKRKLGLNKILDGNGNKITLNPSGTGQVRHEVVKNNGLKNLDNKVLTANHSIDIRCASLFLTTNMGTLKNINFEVSNGFEYDGSWSNEDVIDSFGCVTGFNFGTIEGCSLNLKTGYMRILKHEAAAQGIGGKNTNIHYGFNWLNFVGGFAGISCGTIKNVIFTNNANLTCETWGWQASSNYNRGAKSHVGGVAGALYGGAVNGVQVYGNGVLNAKCIEHSAGTAFPDTSWYIKNCGYVVGTTSNKSSSSAWGNETTFKTDNVPEGTVSNVYIDATIDVPAFTVSWSGSVSPEYKGGYVVGDVSEKAEGVDLLANVNSITITSESGAKNNNRKNDIGKITTPESDTNPNPKKHLYISKTLIENVGFADNGQILLTIKKPADNKEEAKNLYFHELYEEVNGQKKTVYATYLDNNIENNNVIVGANRSSYTIKPQQNSGRDVRTINWKIGKFYNATCSIANQEKIYDGVAYSNPQDFNIAYNNGVGEITETVKFADVTSLIKVKNINALEKTAKTYNLQLYKDDYGGDVGFYRAMQNDTSIMEMFLIDLKKPVDFTYTINKKPVEFVKQNNSNSDYNAKAVTIETDVLNKVLSDDVKVAYLTNGEIKNAGTYTLNATLVGADAENYKFETETPHSIEYVINKINVDISPSDLPTFNGEYSPSKSLSYYTFKNGIFGGVNGEWSWDNGATIPTCNYTKYKAIFTPILQDAVNYNATTFLITVSLAAAVPNVTVVPEFLETYEFNENLTLESFDISKFIDPIGTWSWADKTTHLKIENNEIGYSANFSPTTSNYSPITKHIIIRVSATNPTIHTMPTTSLETYDGVKTLENVTFSENAEINTHGFWSWVEKDVILQAGEHVFEAVFTATYSNGEVNKNYSTLKREFTINVLQAYVNLSAETLPIICGKEVTKDYVNVTASFADQVVLGEYVVAFENDEIPLTKGTYNVVVTFTPNAEFTNFKETTAMFEITCNPIIITFKNIDGLGSKTEVETYYNSADEIVPPRAQKEHYEFAYWQMNDEKIEVFTNFLKDETITAVFVPEEYAIIVNLNGGSLGNEVIPETYNIETKTITLPIATKAGYKFVGWHNGVKNVETIENGSFGEVNLSAVFELDGAKNVVILGYDAPVTYGEQVTLQVQYDIVENLTYSFKWYKNDVEILDSNSSTLILNNVADSGEYKVEVVVSDSSQNVSTLSEIKTVQINKAQVVIDTTEVLKEYVYSGKAYKITSGATTNIKEAEIVYENKEFTDVNTYSINIKVLDSDNYWGASVDVVVEVKPANVLMDSTLKSIFVGEPLKDKLVNPEAYFIVSGTRKVVNGTYTLSWENGVAPSADGTYNVKIVFTPAENETNFAETTFVEQIEVKYILVTFKNVDGNGSVETRNATYKNPEEIDVPVASKEHYTFVNWLNQNEPQLSFAGLEGNLEVTANFKPLDYNIYVNKNGGTVNGVIPEKYNIESETINLPTDVTKNGYIFVGWVCDGEPITQIEKGSNGIKTIVATFRLDVNLDIQIAGYTKPVTFGESITLVANHTKTEGLTYRYIWHFKNTQTKVSENNSITIKNVADSGEYKVEVLISDGDAPTSILSEAVNVVINKAQPIIDVSKIKTEYKYSGEKITINSGAVVKDARLPYNEVQTNIIYSNNVLTNVGEYKVKITSSATENYLSAETTCTVNVVKVSPTITLTKTSLFVNEPCDNLQAKAQFKNEVVKGTFSFVWKTEAPKTNGKFEVLASFVPDLEETNFAETLNVEFLVEVNYIVITFNNVNGNGSKEEIETTYNSNEAVKAPVASKNYYTFVNWYNEDVVVSEFKNLKSNLQVVAKFTPVNFKIKVQLNGGTLLEEIKEEYNIETETIILTNKVKKDGYIFAGWQLNGQNITQITKGSTGDITICATYNLIKPSNILIKGYSGNVTYGKPLTLNVTHSVVKGVTYSYVWYKDGVEIKNENKNTLTIKNVADSGNYSVTVKAKTEYTSSEVTSIALKVIINKAEFILENVPEFTVDYNKQQTLKDIVFTNEHNKLGVWSWLDSDVVPTTDVKTYSAKFVPTDENYKEVITYINVTVKPKQIEIDVVDKNDKPIESTIITEFEFSDFNEDFYKINITDESLLEVIVVEWYKKQPIKNSENVKAIFALEEGFEWVKVISVSDVGEYKAVFKSLDDNCVLPHKEVFVTIKPKAVNVVWENVENPVVNGKFVVKCYYKTIGVPSVKKYLEVLGGGTEPGKYELYVQMDDPNYVINENSTKTILVKKPESKPDNKPATNNSSLGIIAGACGGGLLLIILIVVIIIIVKRKNKKK